MPQLADQFGREEKQHVLGGHVCCEEERPVARAEGKVQHGPNARAPSCASEACANLALWWPTKVGWDALQQKAEQEETPQHPVVILSTTDANPFSWVRFLHLGHASKSPAIVC